MNWVRIVLYGVALWLVPFALSFALFGIHDTDRSLFESLITLTGVGLAILAAYFNFRDAPHPTLREGLVVGLVWAGISIAIDLPIFLLGFHLGLLNYLEDIALTYLAFPIIAVGVAQSMHIGTKSAK